MKLNLPELPGYLLLMLVLRSSACLAEQQGIAAKGEFWADWFLPGNPRVIETGIEVERWIGSDQFIAEWLDERRIAFSEVIDPGIYEKYDHHKAPMPSDNLRIVFYDTVAGKKETYKPGKLVCLKNGRVAYRIIAPSQTYGGTNIRTTLMYGMLGDEQPYTYQKNEILNSFDCEIQKTLPGAETGNAIRYLKREHGYIDTGALNESRQRRARYIRADGRVIELPFKGSNLGAPILWLEYLGGYRVPTIPESPLGTDDYQATNYLLKPDGTLKVFPVSINKMGSVQTRINYLPVPTGAITYMQTPVAAGRMHGASGIYFDNGDNLTRIHGAFVTFSSSSLSPNGCKLPFASMQTMTYTYQSPAHLMILDVCGDKK